MTATYTDSLALGIPGVADRLYNLVIDPNWGILDNMAALGPLATITVEHPASTSLYVAIAAGTFRTSNGSDVSYAGTAGFVVTASVTSMLWLDETGTVQIGSAFPTSGAYLPLASVTADSGKITNVTDKRRYLSVIGGQSRPPTRTITSTTGTTTRADGVILADATTGAIAITLGTLATTDAGLPLVIIKTDASAHAVTIATASGGTVTLANQYDATALTWSGTEWTRIVAPVVLPTVIITPLTVQANESPSTTLSVQVSAGTFLATNGAEITYAGTTGLAVTTATTTAVWLTDAGVIATGSAYPTGPIVRLATVTAGATTVTSIADDRRYASARGGSPRNAVRTVTAATDTTTIADRTIRANATAAAIAITLPSLTTADAGTPVKVSKVDSSANAVTVAGIAGGTVTLSAQFAFVVAEWDGSAWLKFSA